MTTVLSNFIDGAAASADGRVSDLIDPTSEEVFATAPVSSEAEVDAACHAAAQAFETWRETTPRERRRARLRRARGVEAHAGEPGEGETRTTGKPKALVE